jgi:hypothetical protein
VLSGRRRLLLLVGLAARRQPCPGQSSSTPLQTHAPLTVVVQPLARRLLHREATPIEGDRIDLRPIHRRRNVRCGELGPWSSPPPLDRVSPIRATVVPWYALTVRQLCFPRQRRCSLEINNTSVRGQFYSTRPRGPTDQPTYAAASTAGVAAVEETVCFLFL